MNTSIKHWLESDLQSATEFSKVVESHGKIAIGCLPPPIIEHIPRGERSDIARQLCNEVSSSNVKPVTLDKQSKVLISVLGNLLNTKVMVSFNEREWRGEYGYCFKVAFPSLTTKSYALKFWNGKYNVPFYVEDHGPFAEIRTAFAAARLAPNIFSKIWLAVAASQFNESFMISEWIEKPTEFRVRQLCNPRPVSHNLGHNQGNLFCRDTNEKNFAGRKCIDFGYVGKSNKDKTTYEFRKKLRTLRYAAIANDIDTITKLHLESPNLLNYIAEHRWRTESHKVMDIVYNFVRVRY